MRPIDADALIEVVEKSMAENPHKDKMQRGMHTHEHKYFLTLLAGAPTIQPEKAQLSKEGTTSDLISKTETVEHLRRVLEATVPNTDYDEGYIDGIEFGISTVSTMPTIQPQSTAGQLNDGARSTAQSTDLINRQQALNALMEAVKSVGVLDADDIKTVFDMLPSVQHEKGQHSKEGTTSDMISRQAAIDVVEKNACNTQRIMDAVNNLPTAQPEPQEGHWIPHESPDGGKQYECSRCGVLWEFNDGTPEDNEAYFCPKCGARMTTSTK